jgi:outer membrane protein TolC
MQNKTILPLRDPGDYTLEIRDATADLAGADFQYRVQVRPQVPHIGQVRVDADSVNLAQGQAKTIRVAFDREEDYRGAVIVAARSLPPGISAVAGADYEPDKDPPSSIGKRERYTPRTERVVLMLTADADAPVSTQPLEILLEVRPVVDGKPGEVLSTKTIPMMVLPKP